MGTFVPVHPSAMAELSAKYLIDPKASCVYSNIPSVCCSLVLLHPWMSWDAAALSWNVITWCYPCVLQDSIAVRLPPELNPDGGQPCSAQYLVLGLWRKLQSVATCKLPISYFKQAAPNQVGLQSIT